MKHNDRILIIAEMPVVHKGYIRVFNKIKADYPKAHFYMGFLDNRIVRTLTKLEPDIRKILYRDVKKIVGAFLPLTKLFILNKSNLNRVKKDFNKIIILKGEKSEDFAKKYLVGKKEGKLARSYDIRLVWQDKRVAELKGGKSDIPMKEREKHRKIMRQVFEEIDSSKCWWRQTGAALVKNNKIILTGFNEMMPTDDECYKIGCVRDNIAPGKSSEICSAIHAEASVIVQAASLGISLKGLVLYATHFPCPACAKLIALSGIKKVIYSRGHAVFDGARVMRNRGVKLIKI